MEMKSKKIWIRYYSDSLEEVVVETLWAKVIDEEKGFLKAK